MLASSAMDPWVIGALCMAGSGDAAVFSCLAERAPALLRRLRADNVPAFARLFTAAVMQARRSPSLAIGHSMKKSS